MLAKGLLFALLLYVVNEVHFPWLSVGIPGIAPVNVLFILALFATRSQPETIEAKPILTPGLLAFFGALTFGFLWAQVRSSGDLLYDVTALKNALFFPLFYFLYLKCRQDLKTTRQLIIWILVIAAVAGLEAMREGLAYGIGKYHPFKRASGPFGVDWHNANRAAVFYGMFMPMFVALALFLKGQKLWRIAAIGGCFLLTVGTLFTYSRQGYFMILLAVAVLLFRRSIVVAMVIGALLVSMAGLLPESVFQRVEETKQKGKHGEEEIDGSTASRWEIWEGAFRMAQANPIGVGFKRFSKEISNYSTFHNIDAHNFYVLTFAEDGPQGLLTLLFLIYTCFKLARWMRERAPPDDPEAQALTIGFTICTLNMALGGVYGSPTLEGAVMAPYWALCGLLERYIHLKTLEGGSPQPAAAPRDPSLEERFPLARYLRPGS